MSLNHLKTICRTLPIIFLIIVPTAHADWGTCGITPSSEYSNGSPPRTASDGAGGSYICWIHYDFGGRDLILARVDGAGTTTWETVILDDSPYYFNDCVVVADGAGGALVVWDQTDAAGGGYHSYAQRIDSSGSVHSGWSTDGVRLCSELSNQQDPVAAPDGSGGVIVAWSDYRTGSGDPGIFAQHVLGSGTVASGWPASGLEIMSSVSSYVEEVREPVICEDGAGGVFVGWTHVVPPSIDSKLYARRIAGDGTTVWETIISNVPRATRYNIFSTSSVMYITWQDSRNGDPDIFAQKVNAGGYHQWTPDGFPVCVAEGIQTNPEVTDGGAQAGIFVWEDYRTSGSGTYAQSVSSGGSARWALNGIRIGRNGENHKIAPHEGSGPNDNGGVIAVWESESTPTKLIIQAVDNFGLLVFSDEGNEMCAGVFPSITSDGSGGAIYAWGGSDLGANRLQWAICPDNLNIVSGSDVCYVGPMKPNYKFDWIFSWKTNGYPGYSLDEVYIGDNRKTTPACSINVGGQAIHLAPGSGGTNFEIKPLLNGKYQHTVTWLNRDCVAPCKYQYSLHSAGSSWVDGGMAVTYCMAGGLLSSPEISEDSVQMSAPMPNPFNPKTELKFFVPAEAKIVSLAIFDLRGRKIKSFGGPIGERQWVTRTWLGTDDSSRKVPSGLYFAILEVDGRRFTEKLALLK